MDITRREQTQETQTARVDEGSFNWFIGEPDKPNQEVLFFTTGATAEPLCRVKSR